MLGRRGWGGRILCTWGQGRFYAWGVEEEWFYLHFLLCAGQMGFCDLVCKTTAVPISQSLTFFHMRGQRGHDLVLKVVDTV